MMTNTFNNETAIFNTMVGVCWVIYWLWFAFILKFEPFLDMDDYVLFWLFSVPLVGFGNFTMLVSIIFFERLHTALRLIAIASSLSINLTVFIFFFRLYWG
jgi:hypothetical protein